MPDLSDSDPAIIAVAEYVANRLTDLGHQSPDPMRIVQRMVVQNPRIPDLPPMTTRRWLSTEVAVLACELACPRHPGTAAHGLGLRPVIGWGWGASERLMDELDAVALAAIEPISITRLDSEEEILKDEEGPLAPEPVPARSSPLTGMTT